MSKQRSRARVRSRPDPDPSGSDPDVTNELVPSFGFQSPGMDVIPTIRATREELARDSSQVPLKRWTGTYDEYIQSDLWRRVRDRAIRLARWKCERCSTQRSLQVHHKTYARLGCESPEDLEVLCLTCHMGHHIDQDGVQGIYVAITSKLLSRERFSTMADLLAAIKNACAGKGIAYDDDRVWKAVSLLDAKRRGILDAPEPRYQIPANVPVGAPVRRDEVRAILHRLGLTVAPVRVMPSIAADDTVRDQELANQMRQQAAAMVNR